MENEENCWIFYKRALIHHNTLIHNSLQTETHISEMAVSILLIREGIKHCAVTIINLLLAQSKFQFLTIRPIISSAILR